MSSVADNVRRVLEECVRAATRAGRDPGSTTVIAVTKTHPLERVLEAWEAGIRDFGENRVQEAETKWSGHIPEAARLHMIGRLQRNKARRALELFDTIHSCDSLELARRLSRLAGEPGGRGTARVLLEVNTGGESTKAGFSPAELAHAMADLVVLPSLELRGLMTVAPVVPSMEEARPYFSSLRKLSELLRNRHPELGPELSMGMTDDYPVAIEEGATLVRVGRAIFGARQTH